MSAPSHATAPVIRKGIGYWMARVLDEADTVQKDFAPGPVHDLRVAIRRCRSIGEVIRSIDSFPAWRKMRRTGGELFRELGELRDIQVMMEWIAKLGSESDPATVRLMQHCREREQTLKAEAAVAVAKLPREQWREWGEALQQRMMRAQGDTGLFEYLAVERYEAARQLHRVALQNRSKTSLHNLRIGVKKFRYLVENFLPEHHERWKDGLRGAQEILGGIHDLDVLWDTALRIQAFPDAASRAAWQKSIQVQRAARAARYREVFVGRGSLWDKWRSELPSGLRFEALVEHSFEVRASLAGSDVGHLNRVKRIALQIYDALRKPDAADAESRHARILLRAAACMHAIGKGADNNGYQKRSAKLIRRSTIPIGWTAADLETVALVVRFHRGSLPRDKGRIFAAVNPELRDTVKRLAGILRLAHGLARLEAKQGRATIESRGDALIIRITNFQHGSPAVEDLARERYLFEWAWDLPVWLTRG